MKPRSCFAAQTSPWPMEARGQGARKPCYDTISASSIIRNSAAGLNMWSLYIRYHAIKSTAKYWKRRDSLTSSLSNNHINKQFQASGSLCAFYQEKSLKGFLIMSRDENNAKLSRELQDTVQETPSQPQYLREGRVSLWEEEP